MRKGEKIVEEPQVQTVERLYPVPQVMTREVLVPVAVLQVLIVDVPVVTHGQARHIDRIVDLPAVCKRQEPLSATAQKTHEVSQIQFLGRVDDVLVSVQRSAPMIQKEEERTT